MTDTATLDYAAAVLKVSMQTARRMAKRNMIKGIFRPDGTKRWLVHRITFDAWVLEQATSPVTLHEAAVATVIDPRMKARNYISPQTAAILGPRYLARHNAGLPPETRQRRS